MISGFEFEDFWYPNAASDNMGVNLLSTGLHYTVPDSGIASVVDLYLIQKLNMPGAYHSDTRSITLHEFESFIDIQKYLQKHNSSAYQYGTKHLAVEFQVSAGLVVSIVLMAIALPLFRGSEFGKDLAADGTGILHTIWLCRNHPRLQQILEQVDYPSDANLRAARMVRTRLVAEGLEDTSRGKPWPSWIFVRVDGTLIMRHEMTRWKISITANAQVIAELVKMSGITVPFTSGHSGSTVRRRRRCTVEVIQIQHKIIRNWLDDADLLLGAGEVSDAEVDAESEPDWEALVDARCCRFNQQLVIYSAERKTMDHALVEMVTLPFTAFKAFLDSASVKVARQSYTEQSSRECGFLIMWGSFLVGFKLNHGFSRPAQN
ncbi:hypothetical protein C8R45DRAFT_938790 [Mycena sanguinolenta]|nr:hypothetical protein C8R45DRAFT_938790 [Mycena sanguinolenta]